MNLNENYERMPRKYSDLEMIDIGKKNFLKKAESTIILYHKIDEQQSARKSGVQHPDYICASLIVETYVTDDDYVMVKIVHSSPTINPSKRKSFLFNLSKFTSLPILMDWIRIVDYGRLDSAVCNVLCRNHFIRLTTTTLIKNVLRNSENQFVAATPLLLTWLAGRGIASPLPLTKIEFTNVTLSMFFEETKQDMFYYLEMLFKNFRSIKIHNLHDNNCHNFAMAIQAAKHLTELIMTDSDCSTHNFDFIINSVAVNCKQLTVLDVSNCADISEQCIINICKQSRKLVSLNVSNCVHMSQHFIHAITVNCDRLRSLNISGCVKIQKNEIMVLGYYQKTYYEHIVISDILISDFAFKLYIDHSGRKLVTLDVGIYTDKQLIEFGQLVCITDSGICSLTNVKCPSLLHINLRGCAAVTNIGISLIARNFPDLQSLNVHGLVALTDTALSAIAQYCSKLKHLVLGEAADIETSNESKYSVSFSGEAIAAVSASCSALSVLLLSRAKHVNVSVVEQLLLFGSDMLSTIDISHTKFDCKELTVCMLAHGCSLTSLNLAHCNLTNSLVNAIAAVCSELKRVNLSGNHMINDTAVTLIVRKCVGLTSINLQSCYLLTSTTIYAIGDRCRALTALFFTQNSTGNNALCVEYVLLYCSKLKRLYLSGTNYVAHVSCWRERYASVKIILETRSNKEQLSNNVSYGAFQK